MSWVSNGIHRMGDVEFWETAAKFAPLFTTTMAVIAAGVAIRAIYVQRNIARKRAAIDFFLKTEMDNGMVEMYNHFKSKEEFLSGLSISAVTTFRADNPGSYEKLRTWLNTLELIAIGVRWGAFEKSVCFHYWRNVLTRGFKNSNTLIIEARNAPSGVDGKKTYIELERLANSWEKRGKREKSLIWRVLGR